MNTNQRILRVGLVILLLAAMLLLGYTLGSSGTGLTAAAALAAVVKSFAPTPTSFVPVGQPIPIKPLTGLTSLNATVQINANGLLNGQRVQGGLTATVATNGKDQTQINVSGPLLGDIIAQVGGSAMSLFTPSQIQIYKVPQGTYVVIKSLFDVCVKPKAANSTEAVERMSPQTLLGMFTSPEVARGTLVGNETVNGQAVKHYVIDGPTFLAAAQKSSDSNLSDFGNALWSAQNADLYVSTATQYPVAFQGSYSGQFDPLKFQGDFDVRIDVTGINQPVQITLPASCKNPISQ